jgi:hypothetical protein
VWGCAPIQPVIAGRSAVFVGRSRRVVRDMAYSLEADGFDGEDLTLFAQHLFAGKGKEIVEIAYQQEPGSIVWAVLADGTLASGTYLPRQRVIAWSRHRTAGRFTGISSLVNVDGTDRVYFVVSREIGGRPAAFVEVMKNPVVPPDDLSEAFYVDCGLSYQGPPSQILRGLEHLEGMDVEVLADGNHSRRRVENGAIRLEEPAGTVHAGLGYEAVLETLDMQPPEQPVKARPRGLVKAEIHLEKSVSCLAGPAGGEGDEIIHAEGEGWPRLATGRFEVFPEKQSGNDGFRLRLKSDKPYPLCILAVSAMGEYGAP